MKITIIPLDKTVYQNGISYSNLELINIPTDVSALQFDNENNNGWLEFFENNDGTKANNQLITELPFWAIDAMNKWDNAKISEDDALEKARIHYEQSRNLGA
jgi:hypothetical protein